MTRKLRVIQWGTGNVGKHAVAAVHEHADLELVGALVYSDDKAGRDVGEIAGIDPIGVIATKDVDEILALDADCVLFHAQGDWNPPAALDDICRILASGKNVVSTAVTAWIYPKSSGEEVVERLEAACAKGQSSFHGTGIEPGWGLRSTAPDHVRTVPPGRFAGGAGADGLHHVRPAVRIVRRHGLRQTARHAGADGRTCYWRAVVPGPADAGRRWTRRHHRGLRLGEKVATTDKPIEIKAGRVEVGTVSAVRFAYTAIIEGRRALTVEHITRLGPDQAPHWPNGRGWKVTVEGLPSMVLESRIAVHDEDDTDQACLGTAMHAVHAVAPVCAAAPGIRTFLDLPTIVGRGVLSKGLSR